MFLEGIFQLVLVLAAFLCSLVAGFLFAFASVVMPGIKQLNDREFVRAFQLMDGIIQNNQPIFIFVWVGSIVALVSSVALGILQLDGTGFIILTMFVYLLGVQLPTIFINIPLNNKLQMVKIDVLNETSQKSVRKDFEQRWNQVNVIRTVFACLASVMLIIQLLRL